MHRLTRQIGQLFVMGFPGEAPPASFLDFIAEEGIGGVILFEGACRTREVVSRNIEQIRAQYRDGVGPFIAVDQEGGRVCRLKGAPAEYRGAAEYGRSNDLEHFVEDYSRTAVFMQSLGINLNLAPVADIFLEPDNTCLSGRCFGETAEAVVPFVEAAVSVSGRSGLLSCLKHFPGLGAAKIDPHKQTAVATYDEVIWRQREMVPFAAGIERGADLVMTTHLRLADMGGEIATGSERIITRMLRQTLSFDGPVITDDLMMAGAAELGNVGERTVAAFNAGHDLMLFGEDCDSAMRAYDYFYGAVQRGEIDRNRLETSLSRVSGIKFKLDSTVLR